MSIKDVIPEGIESLVPDNLSNRTPLSDLRSILVRDAAKVDPTFDITGARTETETRPELLAAVPEFSGFEFDPTQRSYIEDLYALYSGGVPTRDVAMGDTAQIPGAINTLVNTGGQGQATSDLTTGSTPAGDAADGLTQSGTFAGQPTFTTTPGTTVDNITGDITNPDGSYGGNIVDEVALTGLAPSTPLDRSISVEDLSQPSNIGDFQITTAPDLPNQTGVIPEASIINPRLETRGPITVDRRTGELLDASGQDIGNIYDEVALTGAQTDSLSALAKASNSIADFGKKVQDTLGGVFDSVNNTIDVFGQKFNVAKTATGVALNAAFGAPVSFAFGLADQVSGALPQSNQSVADVLTQKYGVDDQGKVQGNPADNVFAGTNAVSMFGNPIEAAQKRIDNVVDPAKKEKFQKQLNEVVNEAFVAEDDLIDSPTTIADLEKEIKDTANVEVDLPTSTVDTFRGPTIAEVTDGPASDDDPTGPPEGPGITADDAFEESGPSNVGGPPSGPGETSADAEGPSGPSDASASAQDAARGGQYEGGGGDSGGGGGKVVCTMMNESYGFGSFRNKIWLKHSKNLAPEYQRGYHKIFLPLVKLSKTNKILKKTLEHIAVHRTIDIRQESRGKVHLLGRVYRKILEPICYWVGRYAKR